MSGPPLQGSLRYHRLAGLPRCHINAPVQKGDLTWNPPSAWALKGVRTRDYPHRHGFWAYLVRHSGFFPSAFFVPGLHVDCLAIVPRETIGCPIGFVTRRSGFCPKVSTWRACRESKATETAPQRGRAHDVATCTALPTGILGHRAVEQRSRCSCARGLSLPIDTPLSRRRGDACAYTQASTCARARPSPCGSEL